MTIPAKRRRRLPWAWLLLLIVLVAAGAWAWRYQGEGGASKVEFKTVVLTRGEVTEVVNATGTLNAVTQVEVGSQVSGIIHKLYVDYNSVVTKGQVLAELDPRTFQAAVEQQQASLNNAEAGLNNALANAVNAGANVRSAEAGIESAQAKLETTRAAQAMAAGNVESARANVEKAQADTENAQLTYDRTRTLLKKDLVARSDVDTARTTYLTTKASLAAARAQLKASQASHRSAAATVRSAAADLEASRMKRDSTLAQLNGAQAQVKQAESQVRQVRANLQNALVDLSRTRICAPIDGIVLDRKVNIGTTVAANFQAPDLFTMAKNLDQLEVYTNVDEADMGNVRQGAEATFTIDAFPGENFKGTVRMVRQAPVTVQNVVTYVVVVSTRNVGLKMKPGMTATVSLHVRTKKDVLLIPNEALRFKPPASLADESASPSPRASGGARGAGTGKSGGRRRGGGDSQARQVVYVVDPADATKLKKVRIRTGLSDGTNTEIVRSDLKEGDAVVTSVIGAPGASSTPGGRPRMRMF